jgi:alpha-tubulin suppressor-like RCC1 family protein
LKQDGSVVAWGCGRDTNFGQCAVPPAASSGVTAIAAGLFHSLALKQDGSVIAWGCGLRPPCRVPKVVGKRLTSARLKIAKSHCRTGRVRHAYSRKRKKGIVISQSRRPGRVLPAQSKVNLLVSRGRRR